MYNLRRALVFSAVSVVSMFAWALPAQAGTATADCVIAGHADAAVMLQGGTGTYGFTEFSAACAGGTEGKTGVAATATLDISSNGTFTNSVCGTGDAADDNPGVVATVTSTDAQAAASLKAKLEGANLAYTITFAAGAGVLEFTAETGGGAIDITPDGDVVSPPQCVDGFNVAGDVVAVIDAAP